MNRCAVKLSDLDAIHVTTTVDHLVWKSASCWYWRGKTFPGGYGVYGGTSAHRFVYEEVRGPIPKGMVLDHFVCDNPKCVNPWHVRPTTQRENVLRSDGVTARNARKTHCKNKHPLTPENVYEYKGYRYCRTCQRRRSREWKARQRT